MSLPPAWLRQIPQTRPRAVTRTQKSESDLMILGYIFVGIVTGLIGAITAAVMGASFWVVICVYTLAGSVCAIGFAAVQMVLLARAGQDTYLIPADENGASSHPDLSIPANLPGPLIKSRGMRTLVVDDDPFILELVEMIGRYNKIGEVVTVTSGKDALALLSDPHTIFDNLLIDISMPNMNGIDLCCAVRDLPAYRETPITMLTAMRDITHMGDAFRAGADDYATKPFDVDQLAARLQKAQVAFVAKSQTTAPRARTGSIVQAFAFDSLALVGATPRDAALPVIEAAALSNYLTQLPRKDVAKVHVMAVNINLVAAFHADPAPQRCAALLEEIAIAASGSFGTDQTVMAFTPDCDLLIASQTEALPTAQDLEAAIKAHLTEAGFAEIADAAQGQLIAVGAPVVLQGSKEQRATLASTRAINFAERRAMHKRGGSVVAFLRA